MKRRLSNRRARKNTGVKQLYYVAHAAKRFAAKRFSHYKARWKAERSHCHMQREELPDRPYVSTHMWTNVAGKHRRKYNSRWIEVERQSKEREAVNERLRQQEINKAVTAKLFAMLSGSPEEQQQAAEIVNGVTEMKARNFPAPTG